jgi:hypothetical protein
MPQLRHATSTQHDSDCASVNLQRVTKLRECACVLQEAGRLKRWTLQGNYAQAEPFLQTALNLALAGCGETCDAAIQARNDLAVPYKYRSRFAEAMRHQRPLRRGDSAL